MNKLRLNLEVLVVESFVTEVVHRGLGTVRAQGASDNPCASEVASCNCTMKLVALDGCDSQDEHCGGGGSQTCPAEVNTCAYGCTNGYGCTVFCATQEGTCQFQSCAITGCVGGCAEAVSNLGTCEYQNTCAGDLCAGTHTGGWPCVPGAGAGNQTGSPCINHSMEEVTCVQC